MKSGIGDGAPGEPDDSLDRLLAAVKIGGLTVIDDLTPEAAWPEEWHGQPDLTRAVAERPAPGPDRADRRPGGWAAQRGDRGDLPGADLRNGYVRYTEARTRCVRRAVSRHEPEIQTIDAADVGEALKEPLKRVARGKARVIVERDGRPVAAIISAHDLERFQLFEEQRARRWAVVEEVHAQNAHLDPEEVERDIAEAIAEMRAEDRARAATTSPT